MQRTASIVMRLACFLSAAWLIPSSLAGEQALTSKLHHLRSGAAREWADFPEQAEAASLVLTFQARVNATEQTLRLRHRDVKQTWIVRLNDREIGRLPLDENDMVTFWTLPAGAMRNGENVLLIASDGKTSDDVLIGDVRIDDRPRDEVLNEGRVLVSVEEADAGPIPCRLTVVDAQGSLMTVGADSRRGLAVRPGVIYTADGRASFGLPAGKYTLYAGRGFEYGVASARVDVQPGESTVRQMTLRREVPTPGYVACDTHCHTLTFSGHGDATLAERMVTLAGEGIELPIATDHNRHVDYESAARHAGVRQYFTPVIGNECTTPRMGHFNIFPVAADSRVVDHEARDWTELFAAFRKCRDVQVVILNHPRDVHGGFRPFSPEHQLGAVGENLDGWKLEANALELINSGAMQSDLMQVYRDWFGLLNHGQSLTPIGSSDSHDVSRYIVGQGRTYVRCDGAASLLPIDEACRNIVAGRVLVSLGLMCEITVAGRHGPGDVVPASDDLDVAIRVLGPSWTRAAHVALYANGIKIREAEIDESQNPKQETGVKWQETWRIPKLKHDVHLVAVATGPGVKDLFWPIGRPYQPATPVWHSYVAGSTGAVWIDADGSGGFNPAVDYAARLVRNQDGDFARLAERLADYDAAVAAQVAHLLHVQKVRTPAELQQAATAAQADSPLRDGFQAYVDAWKESETARGAK
jgi:hypothetical protein